MIIYKITNLINNKIYVGKDSKNDPNYLGSGIAINKAIKKYGKENFKKEILEKCMTLEDLNIKEKNWIKNLNTISPNGYNLTFGGDGGNTWKLNEHKEITSKKISESNTGNRHSEETKKKISQKNSNKIFSEQHKKKLSDSHKGNSISEETKSKLSLKLKGRKSPTKGMKFTEITKNKMSISHTGKVISDDTKFKIGESNRKPHPERCGENHPGYKIFSEDEKRFIIETYKKNTLLSTIEIAKNNGIEISKAIIKRILKEAEIVKRLYKNL